MRIAAACAGIGVAVGALLLIVLRFVVGQLVPDGIGSPVGGLPRRYVDYTYSRGGSTFVDNVRVLTVVLGVGLVAGLVVGVLLRIATARRTTGARGRAALVFGVSGPVVGTLLAVLLHVYGGRVAAGGGDFGWYAYSPLRNGGIVLRSGSAPAWWPLVLTGAIVGLAIGALAAALRGGWLRSSTSPNG